MGVILGVLASHWWRQPAQFITLISGLAVATALWTGVQAINQEARTSYDQAARILSGPAMANLTSPAGTMPLSVYARLRRAGVAAIPVIEGRLGSGQHDIRILAYDFLSLPPPDAPGQVDDDPATLFRDGDIVFASPETARKIRAEGWVARVIETPRLLQDQVVMDIALGEEMLDMYGRLSRIMIPPDAADQARRIATQLTLVMPEQATDIAALTRSFHLNLTAFGFLAFAVGLFIVHGTIGLAFEQRRGVFRTLRALGTSSRRLAVCLTAELLTLALGAGIIGILLGYLIAAALLPGVAATLGNLYGASVGDTLEFRWQWAASGLGIAVAGTLAASAGALRRVSTLPPLRLHNPQAWMARARADFRFQSVGALLLGGVAILSYFFGSGLIWGFVLLAAVLLAAALVLPRLLLLLVDAMGRTDRGPVWGWFWADTRQQMSGLSLALMALLLALAANLGVGTMVSSFRATFIGWLDQRLASELYVDTHVPGQGAEVRAFIEAEGLTVLPIIDAMSTVNTVPTQIYGVADHATYRDNWPILSALPRPWDVVHSGQGALINEQMANRIGLAPGDRLDIAPGWQGVVAGVYSDYGNPAGQAILGIAAHKVLFPDVPETRFGVRIPPDQVDGLRDRLMIAFDLDADNFTNQAEIKAFSIGVFDRTFAVSAALNVLTLGIAALAILTSLLTLATFRLPQIAPVWALGLTRRELARFEILRSLILTVFTFVAAVPVGLGMAWILLNVVNVQAFGWRLPMQLFPMDWLRLLLFAMVAAIAAAILPMRRLRRTAPADFLKVFANDR